MNIGIFTEVYHPTINGVVVSIDTFVRELGNLGHKVYIFAPSTPNFQDKNSNVFRFKSLPYPVSVDYRFPLPLPPSLFQSIPQLKLEIIHSQTPFFVGVIALYLSKRYKIPLVFTHHTQYTEYTHYIPLPQKPLKRLTMKWDRVYCNHCDFIVAPGNLIKETLKKEGVITPIKVIPTGVNLKEFENLQPERVRKRYKIDSNLFLLMFAGRLAREKNVEFLLNAFSLILEKEPRVHFLVVGGGPEEKNLSSLAKKLSLNQKVTFTGELPNDEVLNCCAASDLFVFSSLTETQGLVILEAMASATPVVALSASGVSDVVTDGEDGFLSSPNQALFRDRVVELIRNEELRKKMGRQARKKAERFSSSNSALELVSIYKSLSLQ